MVSLLARFRGDESGATAIEYGLIGVLVSVGIIAAARDVGTAIVGIWNFAAERVSAAGAAP